MYPQDIIFKCFNLTFRGYDIAEVDAFLDEIIQELERCETQRNQVEWFARIQEFSDQLYLYQKSREKHFRKEVPVHTFNSPWLALTK